MKLTFQINLTNPLLLYSVFWSTALGLNALQLTVNLSPMNWETVVMVSSTIGIFAFLYWITFGGPPRKRQVLTPRQTQEELGQLRAYLKKLWVAWAIGSALEIVGSGGLPIVWLFTGSTKTYVDFGLPSLHGLMIAVFIFSISGTFLDYLISGDRKQLRMVQLLLLWPVCLVSRGTIMWAFLQLGCLYLHKHPISIKNILKYAGMVVAVIWLFGVIGDLRIGENNSFLVGLIDEEKAAWLRHLPTGFMWVYLYITASLNNIVTNIQTLVPGYSLYYSTAALFPSVIREVVFTGAPKYIELSNEAFNTSTFFENFLKDFGPIGAVACVAFLQFVTLQIYRISRRGELWALLAFAVCFQALSLSVFVDTFTSLPNVAQLLLALYFMTKTRRRFYGHSDPAQEVTFPPED